MTDDRTCLLCGRGLNPDSLFAARWERWGDGVVHPGCCDDATHQAYQDRLDAVWDVDVDR